MKRNPAPLLLAATIVLLTAPSLLAQGPRHTKDTLAQVQQNLDEEKAVLLDVREQREWDAGHLVLAELLPLSALSNWSKEGKLEGEAAKVVKELPKDKIVYCHCRSGGRVILAAEILEKKGYQVRPLKPGFQDLLDAGFEQADDE